MPGPPVKKSRTEDIEEVTKRINRKVGLSWESQAKEVPPADHTPPKIAIPTLQQKLAKLAKYSTFEPQERYWLDTGSPELNAALGSRELGLAYGKIIELRGEEHGGKTTLTNVLAGMAQKDGAAVGYIDLEDSRDPLWSGKLGLDFTNVLPIYPKLVLPASKDDDEEVKKATKGKKKKKLNIPRLESAEELFDQAEKAMQLFLEAGYKKQFWILDSVANLTTEMAIFAGAKDRNMRVNMDRAQFLAANLPRWAGLAANYQAMIVLINQMRIDPGVMFGNPETSPGGRALRHACSIRANIKRVGKGQLTNGGKVIGIVGKIENYKNKAGGGSVGWESCGFKIKWNRDPALILFMPVSEIEG